MYFLSYRKFIIEIVVIQLSSESKPSVVHDTDIMNIVVIVSFVVRLKQDISCLRRLLKCNVKLKCISCCQLIERCCHIALTAVQLEASARDLCIDRIGQISAVIGRIRCIVKLI